MVRRILYLTHPQVLINPAIDITRWSLSPQGAARVGALAKSGALNGVRHVISSAEAKAIETARPLATALGCGCEIRERLHENDRSATGYLPPAEFETTADLFFAHPDDSIRGWETARAAQERIVAEVTECLAAYPVGDMLFVGHGAVGTLLYSHLCTAAISRAYDQLPGGGCYFEFTGMDGAPRHQWRPLEQLIG